MGWACSMWCAGAAARLARTGAKGHFREFQILRYEGCPHHPLLVDGGEKTTAQPHAQPHAPQLYHHSAIMGEQLKFRGQLVAHEDWVTSIAATSEVRRRHRWQVEQKK